MKWYKFIFADPETGYASGKKLFMYAVVLVMLVGGVKACTLITSVGDFLELMGVLGTSTGAYFAARSHNQSNAK